MAHNCKVTTGFTLLEMLVSVVLLAVGTLATLKMFGIGMMADTNIEHSTVALALAQGEMESIKNAGTWDAIDSFAAGSTNLGGQFAEFNQEVIVSGDPKNVQVIISWNDRAGVQNLELDTLMTDYNY
jgi:prepilin-type N-terminal cleavage/methylation domain-containing protein